MRTDHTPDDLVLVRRDDLREALDIVQARLYDENLPAWDYRLLAAVNGEATTVEERISPDTVFEPRCDIQRRHVGPWTTQETP